MSTVVGGALLETP